MIRRPPRSTQSRSSAASDVYKRQRARSDDRRGLPRRQRLRDVPRRQPAQGLSLIHISEPTRLGMISYAVFCLKKKKKTTTKKKNKTKQRTKNTKQKKKKKK